MNSNILANMESGNGWFTSLAVDSLINQFYK